MKVIVAGANGLIGQHLLSKLRSRGDEVIALVRDTRGQHPWARDVKLVEWDGKSQGSWGAHLDGADAVVNLSGAPVAGKRWTPAWKQEIRSSRIDSTKALVSALASVGRKPRAFIAGSAIGYYGFPGDAPLDESAKSGDDFLAGVCRDWEAEARRAEPLGVRTVLLRTGVVLAAPGGALQQMLPPFKAFLGGPIGDGQQWFSWIHIEDEVGLILWALDGKAQGPLNAVAPEPVTMKTFCKALGKALHRPSWLPVPAFALRAALGEFANMLTGSQRVVPKAALDGGYAFKFPRVEEALLDLMGGARAPAAGAHAARP